MKNLKSFISQFKKRGGFLVLSASVISKLVSTIVAFYVVRRLEVKEFGSVSYSLMLITPFIPLAGAALDFAYLKFCVFESREKRVSIKNEFFTVGCVTTVLMSLIILFVSPYLLPESVNYLHFKILLFLFITEFLLRLVQASLRVEEMNDLYALSLIWRGVLLGGFSVVGVELFGALGYVLALVLSPLIVFIFLARGLESVSFAKCTREIKKPLKYGLHIGIGSVISQFFLPLGGLLVTNLTNDVSNAALYKAASIIPFALLMLPNMFFKSEFVYLAKNSDNKSIVYDYIRHYLVLTFLISVSVLLVCGVFHDELMAIFFGEEYRSGGKVFFYMMLGVCGGLMLRQLFGNLLAVSGRADWNVINAIISLIIAFPIYYYCIGTEEVVGAAKAFSLSMWSSGMISALLYYIIVFRRLSL